MLSRASVPDSEDQRKEKHGDAETVKG